MPRPPTTILDLPDDLLAHVLRFATGSLRRDGRRAPAISLSDWRLAAVSTAFRRAFLKNVESVALQTPSARRLAEHNWCALKSCTSLRRISISDESELTDVYLIRLFDSLAARGLHLRQAEFTLDRHVTPDSLVNFVNNFGPYITHLDLRVPCYRRVRRRRLHDPHVVYHGAPNALPPLGPQLGGAQAVVQPPPQPPVVPAQLQIQANAHQGAAAIPPIVNNPQLPHQHYDVLPVIHVFAGVPPLNPQQGMANLDQMMAAQQGAQQPVSNPVIAQVVPVHQLLNDEADAEAQIGQVQDQMMMEVVDNLFAMEVPHPQEDVADFLDGIEVIEHDVPPVPPIPNPMMALPPQYDDPARLNSYPALSDDVLARVLSRVPNLRELRIDRARHILNPGILALTKCRHLEVFFLAGCPAMKNPTLATVISSLTKLRVLRLVDMPLVGNTAISAVCTGPTAFTLQVLQLTKIGRVTDRAIRQVVNTCESLESVHIADCPKITGEAASHLSCSLKLKDMYYKPHSYYPLTNRTSRHFSCASSTLRSLQLVGCRSLSLDGIVALGNLPGLRQLHLRGLRHVSQDVMRQLGMFPKLDDLLLDGPMFLTDLGVKVLCGQRGHRFLHLALLDSTNNLTDEALDCVMTWCGSLRTLQIHGYFKPGAIDRLHECIPDASLTVMSSVSGRDMMEGRGSVWDPPIDKGMRVWSTTF